jgi:hypothetical protein
MTIELLIQSIVRQTTVLIAQLATSGGARAPLAQVANQVFLDLVTELGRQGVSRKVSADMFGLGLRTYQRKIQRLVESGTERGRSLWEVVVDYIGSRKMTSRAEIEARFSGDDSAQVRGVLRDLCDSGLVFCTGHGPNTVYRKSEEEELQTLRQMRSNDGLDEFVWAIIYRQGPLTKETLVTQYHLEATELEPILDRLVATNRIEVASTEGGVSYRAESLYIPVGATVGWEAAVFDHFQAMVKTICCRLREERVAPERGDTVGGSTYTLDIWPDHPLATEAYTTLARLRADLVALRQRIEAHNATQGVPTQYHQLVLYLGQCVIPQEGEGDAATSEMQRR